jgi:putative hemolysin
MKTWATEFKQNAMMRWNGVHKFQQKIKIYIESGSYILKTAETHQDLIDCFKLRHTVFYQEFQNIDLEGIDFDKFDIHFDHIVIIHKDSQKIIGTYRVNSSENYSYFYSSTEFYLDDILNLEGPHLELGRACVHQDHRKGTVLSLLWRGIMEYMNSSRAEILFGCSSIKVNNVCQAAMIFKYFSEDDCLLNDIFSFPTKKYLMSDFDYWYSSFQGGLSESQRNEVEKLIPPLLKSYIKFGAKIASVPAFDREFDCIDFLTVLKKKDMANCLARRLQLIQ